jgi:hypothetical protein
VQWLYERGCPLSEAAAITASELGDLDILTWLNSVECPCDYQNLCFEALFRGDTAVLQWARNNAVIEWSAELLTGYLKVAGAQGYLDIAQVCEHLYRMPLYFEVSDFFVVNTAEDVAVSSVALWHVYEACSASAA